MKEKHSKLVEADISKARRIKYLKKELQTTKTIFVIVCTASVAVNIIQLIL